MTDHTWKLACRWGVIGAAVGLGVVAVWMRASGFSAALGEVCLLGCAGMTLGIVLGLRLQIRHKADEAVWIDGEWVS